MLTKISRKLIKYKYILILLSIAVLSHIEWYTPKSILTFSDWYYWPDSAVKELGYSWGTWITQWQGLGSANIQIYFNSFYGLWSLFSKIGLDYDISSKLNLFIPISILGFISPYLLVKKIARDSLIAFACALFYGSSTYYLVLQTAHIPIAFVYSISPLILLFLIRALENNTYKHWLLLSIFYSITTVYEVRIAYILTLILVLYYLLNHLHKTKIYIKKIIFSICIIMGLNLFWILPTVFGGLAYEIGSIAGRGLFGGFLVNVSYALTLYHWSWTGMYPDQNFNPQSIKLYFWIIPLFIFSSFTFYRKIIPNRLFFLLLALIGIFLTKQTSPPFQGAYSFLYDNFPGFVLFRESSKFYLMVAVGYLGLLAYALNFLKNKGVLYYAAVSVIITISMLNLLPLFNKELRGLFVSREIPNDYITLNQMLSSESDFIRVLHIPTYSRWSYFNNSKPRLSTIGLIQEGWNFLIEKDQDTLKYKDAELMIKALQSETSNNLLDMSSIKYIVVPILDKDNDDDFFVFYGSNREYYIDELDKIDYLHKIEIDKSDIQLYENKNYKPHIYITSKQDSIYYVQSIIDVDYEHINPTKYKLSIKNASGPFYLNFSESYHPEWKVYVGESSWFSVLFPMTKNYVLLPSIRNDATLNSFYIDPDEVCAISNVCIKNKDGSYDIELTLYFRPQAYMHAGVAVSGFTLAMILGYLVYKLIKFVESKKKAVSNK